VLESAKVREEHVHALLEVARAASLGTTFQERMAAVLPWVQRLVPRTRATAAVHDPAMPAKLATEAAWFFGQSVGVVHPYAERYMTLDPLRSVYVEASGRPALLSDTEVGRRYGDDPFTAEFLAALGIRHVMLVAHPMPDGQTFGFALHRGPDQPDFDRQERMLFGMCSRDLARAAVGPVLRRALLAQAPAPGRQTTVHGVAFDPEGAVVQSDLGSSPLIDAAGLEKLGAEVSAIIATRPASGTVLEREVPSASGGRLPIRVLTLDARSGVAALAILSHEASDSRFERLVSDSRLTTREKQVAALAIEGLRNRDIAERLGVGVDTVKWHLKTIFQKTKVRGRGGLAAIVLGRA
jgi:DNA-binding CsgD family transcriptional regulator